MEREKLCLRSKLHGLFALEANHSKPDFRKHGLRKLKQYFIQPVQISITTYIPFGSTAIVHLEAKAL